jgi:hypothetical protein
MQFIQAVSYVVRAFLYIGLGGLVVSCGGGGGGESPAPSPSVSIAFESQPTIKETIFEGSALSSLTMQIVASGDIGSLNGKTIYAIVEDPSSLFQNPPGVTLTNTPVGASVRLDGRPQDVSGHFQGNLKVHACLDAGCSVELGNSPLIVPYDVMVQPALTLDRQSINISLPFGQIPPVQTIAVTNLPLPLTSWGVNITSAPYLYIYEPSMTVSSSPDSGASSGVVSLALTPAVPGTYTFTAVVYANASGLNQYGLPASLHFEKTVTITYTVTPDPSVDWVFAPTAGNFTRVQGDSIFVHADRKLLTNTGVIATWQGVEYLSNPPTANGNPLVNQWWYEYSGDQGTETCSATMISGQMVIDACLPVGTYTARVRYTLTKNGVDQDIYWPITLQIVPQ